MDLLFQFLLFTGAFIALFLAAGALIGAFALLWEGALTLNEWMKKRERERRRQRMGIYPQKRRSTR